MRIAQSINNPVLGNLSSLNGVGFFQRLLPALIAAGLVIGVVIFFFMLLAGAVQWISSGGDKGAVEAARGRITNAIIGLVILLSLFAITRLIETFFGIDILYLNLGPLFIGGGASGGPTGCGVGDPMCGGPGIPPRPPRP